MKTLTGKHTETPWELKDNFIQRDETVIAEVYDATTYLPKEGYVIPQVGDANAAFIIRAVNTHEYLLDVLKALKADIESGSFGERGAISMINTAIAKAESNPQSEA